MPKKDRITSELIFTVLAGPGGIRVKTENATPSDKAFVKALANLLRVWMSRDLGPRRPSTGGTLSD